MCRKNAHVFLDDVNLHWFWLFLGSPGLTGCFVCLWEVLHTRQLPLKIWASVRKVFLRMGLKHLGTCCYCYEHIWNRCGPDACSQQTGVAFGERHDFYFYCLWIKNCQPSTLQSLCRHCRVGLYTQSGHLSRISRYLIAPLDQQLPNI